MLRFGRLDLGPEVLIEGASRFAAGVGFHGLVDGLKLRPKHVDPHTAAALIEIVDHAPDIVTGLIAAGEVLDPASAYSGPRPTGHINIINLTTGDKSGSEKDRD